MNKHIQRDGCRMFVKSLAVLWSGLVLCFIATPCCYKHQLVGVHIMKIWFHNKRYDQIIMCLCLPARLGLFSCLLRRCNDSGDPVGVTKARFENRSRSLLCIIFFRPFFNFRNLLQYKQMTSTSLFFLPALILINMHENGSNRDPHGSYS